MSLQTRLIALTQRIRNEFNQWKQLLGQPNGIATLGADGVLLPSQRPAGGGGSVPSATTTQQGIARFATSTEMNTSNALLIPKPQDIRSFVSQQLGQVVTNIVTPFAFPFDGNGSTVLFIQPLSLANISLEGASVTVYRYVGNPDPTLAYLEIVPDSEIQYKRIYNPSAVFPDNPVFHIMFTVAPTVNDSFIVSIYGR